MSYSVSNPGQIENAGARRQNAVSLLLFLLISSVLTLRFSVSPQIMNLLVRYTDETGAFYEKLHFGTYAIMLLLPVAFLLRPVFLRDTDVDKFRALIYFTGWLILLIALMAGLGRASASGYFIDTYVVAGAAGLLMCSVGEPVRRGIGNVVLATQLLSAIIGIGEAATGMRLLPYGANELVFRPTGLADHPLTLGMMCAMAIGFVASSRWSVAAKVASVVLLFVGTAASGARFATLLATAEILAILMFVPWTNLTRRQEQRAKSVVLILVLLGGAALVALLLAGGLLSRFSESLFDENFMARITVYEVFGYVDWKAIIFGADLNAVLKIVNEKLGLPYIESTPVVLIFQLGLPLAIAFTALVIWVFRRLLRDARRPAVIGVAVFFLAALSNNTLSTKTPSVAVVVVLIIAFAASYSGRSRRLPRGVPTD